MEYKKLTILSLILLFVTTFSFLVYAIESQEIEVAEGGGEPSDCTDNTDCTNPNFPRCLSGDCVGCNDHDQCSRFNGLQFCNDENGKCIECLGNTDCPDWGEGVCDATLKICRSCSLPNDCPSGEVCDPFGSGRCVDDTVLTTSCSDDATCIAIDPNLRCISGTCGYPPPPAETQEGIPEEQPFPVFNFYNIIISILILFGYYIRKIYR